MKATLELDELLYRRLKVAAAQRGRKVRELVADGIRAVLREAPARPRKTTAKLPAWFGSLRRYAKNADGQHDLASMRRSVALGRTVVKSK